MGYPLIDVALANGLAIMIAAYVFGDISGGVVNPAVTLGGAIAGKIGWKDAGLYMIAQVGGGIAAGYVLLVVCHPIFVDNKDKIFTINYKYEIVTLRERIGQDPIQV